jgi:FAD/FMN-containing dehydrogenase
VSTVEPDLEPLRACLQGDAVATTDPGWDAARQAWNLATVQQPALVVLAQAPPDVAHTLAFAREHDLRVAPQAPWAAQRSVLNFAERQPGTRRSFPASAADRLRSVKAAYDPDGRIVGNRIID